MRLRFAPAVQAMVAAFCVFLLSVPCHAQGTESPLPAATTAVPATASAEANLEREGNSRQLVGGVTTFQPHSLLGQWNGHIKRFGRHPKLYIDYCQDGKITGSYKGIFGRFPVSGFYSDQTGDITIHVDFSSSILTKFKKLKSGHGVIQANIKDDVLVGSASIPDLGSKSVRWEAVKDKGETSITDKGGGKAGD